MVLDIVVTGAPATDDSGGGGGTATAADTAATIDFEAEPDAGWQPHDPALQPAPGGSSIRSPCMPARPRSRWHRA